MNQAIASYCGTDVGGQTNQTGDIRQIAEKIPNRYQNLFADYKLQRIRAERNILAEKNDPQLSLSSEGIGATNTIRGIIHQSKYNHEIIETTILEALVTRYPSEVDLS